MEVIEVIAVKQLLALGFLAARVLFLFRSYC